MYLENGLCKREEKEEEEKHAQVYLKSDYIRILIVL